MKVWRYGGYGSEHEYKRMRVGLAKRTWSPLRRLISEDSLNEMLLAGPRSWGPR